MVRDMETSSPTALPEVKILNPDEWSASYPHDVSPFGVIGLGGGFSDWTIREEHKASHREALRQWIKQAPGLDQDAEIRARALFESEAWRDTFQSQVNIESVSERQEVLRGGSMFNTPTQCTTMYRFVGYSFKRYADVSVHLIWSP